MNAPNLTAKKFEARRIVLLIDHEASVRDVLQVCLDDLGGWEVRAASTPSHGMALLNDIRPEVILLDAPSIETSAQDLVAKLRKHPSLTAIPIVLITGKARWFSKQQLQTWGVAGALPKPFNPLTLPDQIRQLMGWFQSIETA
jgi:CheY-like chemotaxis protein